MEFNKNQMNGIEHFEGPCQVLAGPGSGKTLTIVNRIHYLIHKHGVKPEEILVITFTKAAALEMERRFNQLIGRKKPVTFGTFHSVFYSILRNTYKFDHGNIFTDKEKYRLIENIVNSKKIEMFSNEDFVKEILADISVIKNNGLKLDGFVPKAINNQLFTEIYNDYEELRKNARKIDFDDMLVLCLDLLTSREYVLREWQERFKFVLVDEFQDINKVQYDVLKLLVYPENNVFIVGDDDQSIYGFRGASSKLMFQFQEDFPKHREIFLRENYRSAKSIISKATKLIEHNSHRFHKRSLPTNSRKGMVRVQELSKPRDESEYIVGEMKKRLALGVDSSEIAVLYRTHGSANSLVEKLIEESIPFQIKERVGNIFDHFIAKDIMAYFRIATGLGKRQDFLQIINRPLRYLGRDSLCFNYKARVVQLDFEGMRKHYEDKDWMMERIDELELDLKVLSTMAPYAGIQYIRKKIGYESFLYEHAQSSGGSVEEYLEELWHVEESSRAHISIGKWLEHIKEVGLALEKQEEKNKGINNENEGIHLMTIHGSKGLEFDTVFVLGVNEGCIPYRRGMKDNLEEERRLLYVAMTRAKDHLELTYVQEKNGNEQKPSRFIEELLD